MEEVMMEVEEEEVVSLCVCWRDVFQSAVSPLSVVPAGLSSQQSLARRHPQRN